MDIAHWKIWENLTFKTNSYRKNFDILIKNENIITEYEGTISVVRLKEKLPPLPIGEYSFSIWNLELAKQIKANVNKLIKNYGQDNVYVEIIDMIKNKKMETKPYQKVIFIHSLILRPDYRKKEVTQEFVEFIYRDYYDKDIGIFAFVRPIQDNEVDYHHFLKRKKIKLFKSVQDLNTFDVISAYDYYGIDGYLKKTDAEINEYKLFSIAAKCGFTRINDSHLFLYSPEKTVERIGAKQEIIDSMEAEYQKK